MRISALSEAYHAEIKKVDGSRKAEETKKSSVTAGIDRSEISSKAQRLSETRSQIEVLASQVMSQPDIRADKVNEVQEKIKNGYYNSPEFIDKLAEKLLSEFGIDRGQPL